jgi:hypothetical protein
VFGAGDDFFLEFGGEIAEVIAVAGDADDEIAVFGGVRLGLAEVARRDHVELDVVAVHFEIGADELCPFVDPVRGGDQRGRTSG